MAEQQSLAGEQRRANANRVRELMKRLERVENALRHAQGAIPELASELREVRSEVVGMVERNGEET